jgi:uncharacterized protein YlxP (DUF503 family)
MNIPNMILAMLEAVAAMSLKPKVAAIKAIIRKIKAHFSMAILPSCGLHLPEQSGNA